jgi:hypothetical protein
MEDSAMKTALDEWVEFTRAWVDEQLAEIEAKDEAAWQVFRAKLFGPMDFEYPSDGRCFIFYQPNRV